MSTTRPLRSFAVVIAVHSPSIRPALGRPSRRCLADRRHPAPAHPGRPDRRCRCQPAAARTAATAADRVPCKFQCGKFYARLDYRLVHEETCNGSGSPTHGQDDGASTRATLFFDEPRTCSVGCGRTFRMPIYLCVCACATAHLPLTARCLSHRLPRSHHPPPARRSQGAPRGDVQWRRHQAQDPGHLCLGERGRADGRRGAGGRHGAVGAAQVLRQVRPQVSALRPLALARGALRRGAHTAGRCCADATRGRRS